jgi:hypothetical protein
MTSKFEGVGVKVSKDGSVYQGFFIFGQVTGKGRSIDASDNEVYEGDFVLGLKEGQG